MRALLFVCVLCTFYMCSIAQSIDQYKQYILDKHNDDRKKQRGSNMNKLVWSDKLEKIADDWVRKCKFDHQGGDYGENLAFNTKTDWEQVIDEAHESWYAEIKDYNYAGKSCGMSCHYTQLVWSATREVGCAMHMCPSFHAFGRVLKNAMYFACWYSPKGNDASEYPYNKGAPCSECLEGQTCDGGLCAGKGKAICEDKNENCGTWKDFGECVRNPKYMLKMCKKACDVCED